MKKELKEIMSLSFPFCKNDNDQLALYFQKINSLAHDAEVYMEQNGLNKENHWTERHHKNYHQS
jgi:hypothetical protein